jgi:Amt family ammonium transporter
VFFYSLVCTAILLLVTKLLVGLRVDDQTELAGLDIGQHRERLGT